jgi:hypothetical protein
LLDTGLSDGKTSKTVEGFKKDDTLTRTEALTFVQRLKKSLKELQDSPRDMTKYYVKITDTPNINTEKIDDYINLTANTDVYQIPSKNSSAIAAIAPQSVQAFEKTDNWYHIHSAWLGDSWIYVNNTANRDSNTYHAPTFVPLNFVDGKWAFEQQYGDMNFNIMYTVGQNISPTLGYPRDNNAKLGEPVSLHLSLMNKAPDTVETVTSHNLEVQIFSNLGLVWRGKLPTTPNIPLKTYGTMGIDFQWNQKDSDGKQVPAGQYKIYLQTPANLDYTVEGKEGTFTEHIGNEADKTLGGTFKIQ